MSGTGCSTPAGSVPSASGTGSGLQGSGYVFGLQGAEPSSLAVWTFGTSTTSWGGVALPLDLEPAGLPGCTLYHNVVGTTALATDAGGSAEYAIVVPLAPALAGIHFPTQWFVFGASTQVTALAAFLVK